MIELERRRTRHPQLIAPFLQEPGREIEVIVVGIDGESILRELFPIQTADLGILAPSSQSFASIRGSLDAGSPLSLSRPCPTRLRSRSCPGFRTERCGSDQPIRHGRGLWGFRRRRSPRRGLAGWCALVSRAASLGRWSSGKRFRSSRPRDPSRSSRRQRLTQEEKVRLARSHGAAAAVRLTLRERRTILRRLARHDCLLLVFLVGIVDV